MCTYLLRHAIFNEQSDLDGKDIISYDLVWLVMRYKYQKDNENVNFSQKYFTTKS